jgi:RsiW-degrading membrane proteinase PrsW (M82 family)
MDKQLRDTPRVALVIAIEKNKAKRNACLFIAIITTTLALHFSWNKVLLLIPVALGIGSLLYHMNVVIVSAELKRRSEES